VHSTFCNFPLTHSLFTKPSDRLPRTINKTQMRVLLLFLALFSSEFFFFHEWSDQHTKQDCSEMNKKLRETIEREWSENVSTWHCRTVARIIFCRNIFFALSVFIKYSQIALMCVCGHMVYSGSKWLSRIRVIVFKNWNSVQLNSYLCADIWLEVMTKRSAIIKCH
jgi:hypothetical protein